MSASKDHIKAALSGADMRVFLTPDPAQSFGFKEDHYIECYDLPYIVISDETIWGTSRRSHLNHKLGEDKMAVNAFSYAPDQTFYGISNYGSVMEAAQTKSLTLKLMPAKQYSELKFIMVDNYHEVWRYGDETTDKVDKAINAGAKFKAALQTESNKWLICPVDLTFFYPETSSLKIRTEIDFLPAVFMIPDQFLAFLNKEHGEFLSSDNPSRDMEMRVQSISTFNVITSDGSYYGLHQIPDAGTSRYLDVILFADI